jgi:predicted Zn-dependent protease with MMP-like domain
LIRAHFEALVRDALEVLPLFFQEKLENVAVVVEEFPSTEVLAQQGLSNPYGLLGLYQGVPRTHKGFYSYEFPDRITIYQKPIEAHASTPSAVRELVGDVVRHEIGHYFGLSEAELADLA